VERLEVLLLMHRQADKWWTAHALSVALRMPPEAAESHLDALSTLNLLDVRVAESLLYRYQPGRPELSSLVDEVAGANYANRNAIAELLARRPSEGLRLFAEAFRFWKGPDNG
jgi:hypothetical protein